MTNHSGFSKKKETKSITMIKKGVSLLISRKSVLQLPARFIHLHRMPKLSMSKPRPSHLSQVTIIIISPLIKYPDLYQDTSIVFDSLTNFKPHICIVYTYIYTHTHIYAYIHIYIYVYISHTYWLWKTRNIIAYKFKMLLSFCEIRMLKRILSI